MNDQNPGDDGPTETELAFNAEYSQLSIEQREAFVKDMTKAAKRARSVPAQERAKDANAYLNGLSDTEFEEVQKRLASGRPTEAEAKLFAKGN